MARDLVRLVLQMDIVEATAFASMLLKFILLIG